VSALLERHAGKESLLPAKEGGTTIARMVLSALAETRRFADGLNFSAVGGNEWAARILSSGCWSAFSSPQAEIAYSQCLGVQDPNRQI